MSELTSQLSCCQQYDVLDGFCSCRLVADPIPVEYQHRVYMCIIAINERTTLQP